MFLLAQESIDPSQWPAWLMPLIIAAVVLALAVIALYLFMQRGEKEAAVVLIKSGTELKKEAAKNQRGTLRRGGNPIDIFISDEKATVRPMPGLVIDRSMRGMCLALETPPDVGSVLSVRRADNSTPWVRVVVKNCRHVGDSYEVGCEFVSVPPASILMMFG